MLILLVLLQITPSSLIVFDPITDLLSFGVEVNFPEGTGLQIEQFEQVVPEFTSIQFNPMSVALKPFSYGRGVSLIVIDACGHRVWSLILHVAFRPIPPTIVPGYPRPTIFKEPCNLIQLEMHWAGTFGANFEIQGTATLGSVSGE